MAGKKFISVSRPLVTVNAKELLRELTVDSPNSKAMAMALRAEIEPKLRDKQQQLQKQFERHPITVELRAGPRASNTSGTLGGYGNLYSFIGFSGGDPTQLVSSIFNEKIRFEVRRKNSRGLYNVRFFIPSLQEIYSLTPIPWMTGKSWVEAVEKSGLSNLGQYLYSASGFGQSSSGTGIQVKNKSSSVTFNTTPYVGKLIEDFKKKLLRLDK